MDSSLSSSSYSNKTLLFNLRVEGIESLRIIIIKKPRMSIVFSCNMKYCSDIFRIHMSLPIFSTHLTLKSWMVSNPLFISLLFIFLSLQRELVNWLISWMVSPISSLFLCLTFLFIFILIFEPVFPGNSFSKVVPILCSVNWYKGYTSPEDPTHFTDHPHVGLPHVVCNMEHHYN